LAKNWKSCKQFSSIEKSGKNCLQLFQFCTYFLVKSTKCAYGAQKVQKVLFFSLKAEKQHFFALFGH